MGHVNYFVLICLLIVAVVCDLHTDRIPNKLIVTGGIAGLALRFFSDKYVGVLLWIGDFLCVMLIFFTLYRFSMMGAGDIKLFAVAAGLMGAKQSLAIIVIAFIIAGVISVILMIYRHNFVHRIRFFLNYLQTFGRDGKLQYMDFKNRDPKACIHFTVPMLIAALLFGILYF